MDQDYILKGKERTDATSFEEVEPIMVWKMTPTNRGPIGLFGLELRVLWDNMVV